MQQAFKFDPSSEKPARLAHSGSIAYDFPADIRRWSRIALVGEAPGAEEVRMGHPFVGRSGQLLDKILEKAGIIRKDSLIANVFRFQPPSNKVDHFFTSRRAAKQQGVGIAEEYGQFGSAWCRSEFAGEIKYLGEVLEDMKPNIIIALGRTPFWALTGANGLLDKVGNALPCRLAKEIQVIPTFHPSFIMRGNWGLQDKWLGHFLAAKKYSN